MLSNFDTNLFPIEVCKHNFLEAMSTERSDITSINRIASYLKVPAGKVAVNNENVCIQVET